MTVGPTLVRCPSLSFRLEEGTTFTRETVTLKSSETIGYKRFWEPVTAILVYDQFWFWVWDKLGNHPQELYVRA